MNVSLFLTLSMVVLLAGCTRTNWEPAANSTSAPLQVQTGDRVDVDYAGTLEDGSVFDTSIRERAEAAGLSPRPRYDPLSFTVGDGQMIAGFERGVIGMREGESKNITLPPEQAYGPVDPSRIVTVQKSELAFPGHETIGPGATIEASDGSHGVVTDITNETITVDFNHPLAGKTLIFEITVRKITRP